MRKEKRRNRRDLAIACKESGMTVYAWSKSNAGFARKFSVFSCQFSVRATGLLAISSVPNSCFLFT